MRDSAARLDSVFDDVRSADAWTLPTTEEQTPSTWVYRRWREVLVHHVDLAASYTPDQWPPLFVSTELGEAASSLAERVTDGAVRVRVTAEGSVASDFVGKEWVAGRQWPGLGGARLADRTWVGGVGSLEWHGDVGQVALRS